jgi:hypothetical protein
MNIETYTPIDCRTWDFSGNGNNVKDLLTTFDPALWKLFEIARPDNDTRGDPGHMENVVWFGYSLQRLVGGDLYLIIPVCEFHDSGWNITGEEWQRLVREGKSNDPKMRFKHQANGALKVLDAFDNMGYGDKYRLVAFSFITDHDTRFREPKDINEQVFRDADILWRFTEPCRRIYHPNLSIGDFVKKLEQDELSKAGGRFYFPVSGQIARLEMVNAAMQINATDAIDKLKTRYPHEVKKMKEFYGFN